MTLLSMHLGMLRVYHWLLICHPAQPLSRHNPSRHLSVQIGAATMFVASSSYASEQHCNSIDNFCKWSFFLQWTLWNTVSPDFLQEPMQQALCCLAPPADVGCGKQCKTVQHCLASYVQICAPTNPASPIPSSLRLESACTSVASRTSMYLANTYKASCYVSNVACTLVVLLPRLLSGLIIIGLSWSFSQWPILQKLKLEGSQDLSVSLTMSASV